MDVRDAKVDEPSLSIPWPSGARLSTGAGAGWDRRAETAVETEEDRRHGRYGAWTEADGDGAWCPADLSDDGWFARCRWLRRPGREAGTASAGSQQPQSLFSFFSLICPRRSLSSPSWAVPGCHRGRGAGGRTGDHRALEEPPLHLRDLASYLLPAWEAEPGEVKRPQKSQSIFNSIFYFSLFSAFMGSCAWGALGPFPGCSLFEGATQCFPGTGE